MSKLTGADAELRLKAHQAAADVHRNGGTRVILQGPVPTPVLIALMNDGFAITPGATHTVLTWREDKTPWLGTTQ